MFQLIATTVTIAALLCATALKPAQAALTTGSTKFASMVATPGPTPVTAPEAGASLATGTNQLPESFDFATAGR